MLPGSGGAGLQSQHWEAEASEFLSSGQSGLQNEFQDSQGYTEKPCLEKNERKQQKK